MSRPVVSVEGLGKEYVIGAREKRNDSLRDVLVAGLAEPYRRLRRLRGEAKPEERIWALKDVSFEVNQGEVLGIIGRNGAGKSTLLKILSRITAPTEGHVRLRGRVASLLEVGTGFHPELTGRENIYLNGSILGMSRAEIDRKFDEIVDFSGVEKFLDTPVKRYSSGMSVRLAFAVAAHLEPEILIIDEVLAVGDAEFQKKCLGKIGAVASAGRTVLFVSHNMAAVQNLCTRCISLQAGRVALDSDPNSAIDNYLLDASSQYGDGLLPAISMRRGDGRTRFTDVRFLDENGNAVRRAHSGKSLRIALLTTGIISPRACRVSIGVSTSQGAPLFVCSTELIPGSSLPLRAKTIACDIPRLPLSGGIYLLTLFLEQDGVVSDWVENGVKLSVDEADFFGSGRLVPTGWEGKAVLVDHAWKSGDVDTEEDSLVVQ